ncbi:MAG: energy transducer TonB [Candidatus Eisenbacteria bacterium]|nr:energy transducer TonB [Candidatus Eisenbacteria bacterium]
MSDFIWARLALSAGIQSLERLVFIMAALTVTALAIGCWRAWTRLTPVTQGWAAIPDRLEPASGAYGSRQLIESYPGAMMRGVGSAGAIHLGLALLGVVLLAQDHPKNLELSPIIIECEFPLRDPTPVVTAAPKARPAPLLLPDPRNAVPSPVDQHLALMDSSEMVLAAYANQFGSPFGDPFGTEGDGEDRGGPVGSRVGLYFGQNPLDEPDPGEFITVDQLPELVWMTEPLYPEMARQSELEGVVELLVLVTRDGGVRKSRLVRSIPGLDDAAVAAATTARFKPALWNGRPVAVWVAMPIRFTLN